jgi:WD40 repeat protein
MSDKQRVSVAMWARSAHIAGMNLQPVASIQHPTPLHRLRFHPTLPLLATVDSLRMAVHVWTWRNGDLLKLASLGAPEVERPSPRITLDVSWHPSQPLLALTGLGGVELWLCPPEGEARSLGVRGIIPDEERAVEDIICWKYGEDGLKETVTQTRTIRREPPAYSFAGFSPTGSMLWASPSENPEGDRDGWGSDWFSAEQGATGSKFWRWDTDLVLHPEGVLMAAFESNQGATLLRFASVAKGPDGERLQTWRRAQVIDVDGYEGLTFSPRGDRFLYRGNAYEDVGYVHEFPSLKLLAVVPFMPEGEDRKSWSQRLDRLLPETWRRLYWSHRENLVFSPDGESLLMGLVSGHLAEVDLATMTLRGTARIHAGPLCALRVRHRDGLLAVADFEGLLRLYRLPHTPASPDTTARPLTEAFLAATEPAPGRAGWDDLKLTDGEREWGEEALEGDLPDNAPTWARLGAMIRGALKAPR